MRISRCVLSRIQWDDTPCWASLLYQVISKNACDFRTRYMTWNDLEQRSLIYRAPGVTDHHHWPETWPSCRFRVINDQLSCAGTNLSLNRDSGLTWFWEKSHRSRAIGVRVTTFSVEVIFFLNWDAENFAAIIRFSRELSTKNRGGLSAAPPPPTSARVIFLLLNVIEWRHFERSR